MLYYTISRSAKLPIASEGVFVNTLALQDFGYGGDILVSKRDDNPSIRHSVPSILSPVAHRVIVHRRLLIQPRTSAWDFAVQVLRKIKDRKCKNVNLGKYLKNLKIFNHLLISLFS